MSDFLTNLVGRSLGTLVVVKPRVPSLYEPYQWGSGLLGALPGLPARDFSSQPAVETISEGDSGPVAINYQSQTLRSRAVSPASRNGQSAENEHEAPRVEEAEPSHLFRLEPPSLIPHPIARVEPTAALQPAGNFDPATESNASLISRPDSFEPVFPKAKARAEDLSAPAFPPSPRARIEPSLVPQQAPPFTSAIRPPLAPRSGGARRTEALPPSFPPSPAIQVSIGKVEVRAVFPEQPVRRAPPPRSRPTVSLDDYLNPGNRGKR